ncbi:MAG TPA: hypothetical protein PKL31_07535 [Fulvivirga sp.]|nr:hypothetical protein [Fulvivirga sp.]
MIGYGKTFAGWYECHTYRGTLAGARIHLYLQFMNIHSTSKDSIIVKGIYKYDKINEPINLRGVLLNQRVLKLTEFHDDNPFAELLMEWGKDNVDGIWNSSNKSYKIQLEKVGYLSDIDEKRVNEPTDIMMESAFKNEYLIGTYLKTTLDQRAKMTQLKVIDKKTNQLKHLIKFDNKDKPIGNVMTDIFSNVTIWKTPKALLINVDDGHMGGSFFMTYNESLHEFVIDE